MSANLPSTYSVQPYPCLCLATTSFINTSGYSSPGQVEGRNHDAGRSFQGQGLLVCETLRPKAEPHLEDVGAKASSLIDDVEPPWKAAYTADHTLKGLKIRHCHWQGRASKRFPGVQPDR